MDMQNRIRERLTRGVSDNVYPGAALAVVTVAESASFISVGHQTYETDRPEIVATSIFDVASVTKSIPTAIMVWMAIEQGKLSLDDPARNYLPELSGTHTDQLRIRHLLSQTE